MTSYTYNFTPELDAWIEGARFGGQVLQGDLPRDPNRLTSRFMNAQWLLAGFGVGLLGWTITPGGGLRALLVGYAFAAAFVALIYWVGLRHKGWSTRNFFLRIGLPAQIAYDQSGVRITQQDIAYQLPWWVYDHMQLGKTSLTVVMGGLAVVLPRSVFENDTEQETLMAQITAWAEAAERTTT
ncbi:hypothetical protein [Aliiroseovarius sp. S253]|uniref:hypothetical protein n=1 Tax=Aliiroseovarius sp. S253 TaxID=3415133 RepID=UPI003C7E59F2